MWILAWKNRLDFIRQLSPRLWFYGVLNVLFSTGLRTAPFRSPLLASCIRWYNTCLIVLAGLGARARSKRHPRQFPSSVFARKKKTMKKKPRWDSSSLLHNPLPPPPIFHMNNLIQQMLDPSVLTDLEELTLCGYCKQKYNDDDQCPKYLSCKHYFCLRCIENNLLKGRELFCAHCWKRTELGDQGADALPTNSPLLALANHFSYLKRTNNGTTVKPIEKERKVINHFNDNYYIKVHMAKCETILIS